MGNFPNCSCFSKTNNQISDIPVCNSMKKTTKKKCSLRSAKTECENIRKYKIRSLVYNQAMAGVKSGECLLNKMCIKQSKNCLPTVSKIKAKRMVSKKSFTSFDFTKESIKSFNFPVNDIKEDVGIDETVFSNSLDITFISHTISQEEEVQIQKAIREHFFLQDLTEDVISLVINELIFFTFPKGKVIYEEGDDGNFFYILAEGEVEATEKGVVKKKYTNWECFGELSLLNRIKREETVTCQSKVSVFAVDGESFRDILHRINSTVLKERFNFINQISIFKPLDNISKYNVAQKIKLKTYHPCDQIISRGDIGDNLYIIKEGLVSCRIGVKEVRKLYDNDYFGQNAILIDVKRALDIVALQETKCYELSRDGLKEALGNDYINKVLFCFFRNCIEGTNLKDIFIESKIQEIFKVFQIKTYLKKQRIIEPLTSDGKINISQNKKIIIIIDGGIYKQEPSTLVGEKGKILGEEIFKDYSKVIPNELIAYPDCISLEANIDDICQVLNIDLNNVKPLHVLNRISKLKQIYLFKNLSDKTLELIAKKLHKVKYKKDEVIVTENTFGETFYLISKGSVRVSIKGKVLRNIEKGNCFGENVLMKEEEVKRTATVTANEKVICYVLTKKEFEAIITNNKTIKEYLQKQLSLQNASVSLSDLYYIKFLGRGKFGTVSLVHDTKNIYAIKAVSRTLVDRQRLMAKYFINERRIMLGLDHPFVVKMVKSLKNEFFCFFLIEFVNGKNLDEYLSKRKTKKNIAETQFYIANLLLILEYLQKRYIAHRDIKPSNIMVDSNGYLKMIDFGTAKVLTDYTSTVIGTPYYIAPEVLQGKGYSLSCDFWSVGVCMYEIFYGIYPFGNYANEIVDIYKEILNKEYIFPSNDEKYKDVNILIGSLLNKKVNKRECNVSALKKSEFFKGFDFDQCKDFKMVPPYIPQGVDLSKYLITKNPYENYVSQDIFKTKNKQYEHSFPVGCNRSWADEF